MALGPTSGIEGPRVIGVKGRHRVPFQETAGAELVRIFPQTYFSVALDLGPGAVEYLQHLDAGLGFRVNPNKQNDVHTSFYLE